MAVMGILVTTLSSTYIVIFVVIGSPKVQRRFKCGRLGHTYSDLQAQRRRMWILLSVQRRNSDLVSLIYRIVEVLKALQPVTSGIILALTPDI